MEIISLGNSCTGGLSLRKLGLKKEAYPFDWVRSNPIIIYDVLINGPKKYLEFGNSPFNNFEISDMFSSFDRLKNFPRLYINYYGQYFTHYINISIDVLIKSFERKFQRFFNKLENSKEIIFLHTTENYILHKITRDNKDIYYEYLLKICNHLKKSYTKLDFKIINIEIDNNRKNTNEILNFTMRYNSPLGEKCENEKGNSLMNFRNEVTEIIDNILICRDQDI